MHSMGNMKLLLFFLVPFPSAFLSLPFTSGDYFICTKYLSLLFNKQRKQQLEVQWSFT